MSRRKQRKSITAQQADKLLEGLEELKATLQAAQTGQNGRQTSGKPALQCVSDHLCCAHEMMSHREKT